MVLSGILTDPYTATLINFLRGNSTSTAVQIDHVVALSDAWQKGAQQLTEAQRVSFANDPLNLLAVDGPANQQKSDGDAATWLPPNKSYRCDYVARQISVKSSYGLWVTQAEHDAMARVLADCRDTATPGQPGGHRPPRPAGQPARTRRRRHPRRAAPPGPSPGPDRRVLRELRRRPCRRRRAAAGRPAGLPRADGRRPRRRRLRIAVLRRVSSREGVSSSGARPAAGRSG